jgi:hypothetical protein
LRSDDYEKRGGYLKAEHGHFLPLTLVLV